MNNTTEQKADKKGGIFLELMLFSGHKVKSFTIKMWSGFKELCKTAFDTTVEFTEDNLLAGTFIGVVVGCIIGCVFVLFSVSLRIMCFLCVISPLEKAVRIIYKQQGYSDCYKTAGVFLLP